MTKRELTPEHKAKLAAGREAAKLAKQNQPIEGVTHRLNPIERSEADPTSLRKAISANCFDCIYDKDAPGTWREQVNACQCVTCPLHKVRN